MNPIRVGASVVAIFALTAALFAAGARLASDPWSVQNLVLSAVAGPVLVLTLGSLYEWMLHRWLYHAPWPRIRLFHEVYKVHHRGHHWHRFPPDKYATDEPMDRIPPFDPFGLAGTLVYRSIAWWTQYAIYLCVAVPFAFVPTWLVTHNVVFTGSFVGVGLFACYMFIRVHDVMHYPGTAWWEHQGWFRFLNRHHYIHHVDERANLNFMLPLVDFLFGNMRTELTAAELEKWPSFSEAAVVRHDAREQAA